MRLELRQAANDMSLPVADADIDLDQWFTLGSSANSYTDGVTIIAIKLATGKGSHPGATPFDSIQEFSEGISKHLRDQAGVPWEKQVQWIRDTEAFTKRGFLQNDLSELSEPLRHQAIDEAFSSIAVGYATGRIMETQVPPSLRSFLKAFKQTLGHIFSLAKDIKAYSDSTSIDPEFKQYLDLATGFSEDTSVGKPTQESSLATTPETLSIGRRGSNREGKTKADRDQFGPKLSEDMSPNENFERATNALSWAIRKKKSVVGIAFRKELGTIDMPWGRPGHAFPVEKDNVLKTHTDGYGLSHIIEKHGIDAAKIIPEIIAKGEISNHSVPLKQTVKYKSNILILAKENKDVAYTITSFDLESSAPKSFKRLKLPVKDQPISKVRRKRQSRSAFRKPNN